jgi:methylated-DNA-[protein]-cysteine S-methyltransferase
METGWSIYESPLGPLTLIAGARGIAAVRFPDPSLPPPPGERRSMPRVERQLAEYFAGERESFDLDLDLAGTPLQLLVWEHLQRIPYGETVSYGELAQGIDDEAYPEDLQDHQRVRAVGAAVGRTPTPIVVPCHRVIGADGSLTGYGGGLPRKRALLDLEQGITALLA